MTKTRLTKAQDGVLTDIIEQMENTDDGWQMPWHNAGIGGSPTNLANGKPYRGFNRLVLMLQQSKHRYTTSTWGTFYQWRKGRSHVRARQKATTLFYPIMRRDKEGKEHVAYFRPFWVFNGDQVTNFNPDYPDLFADDGPDIDRPTIEQIIERHQVKLAFEGNSAFYRPSNDSITMPPRSSFFGSKTSTADEAFYSTLLHEMVHWTGHSSRLDRARHNAFGDEVYAFEELIAELGAAFLCSEYEITNAPRLDHAQYLNNWLKVLNDDKSQLWQAASKAQLAVDLITGCIEAELPHDHREPPAFALEIQPTQADFFEKG